VTPSVFGSIHATCLSALVTDHAKQLRGASLVKAELQGASLLGAELQGASLTDAHLQGARLDGAQLEGASLWRAELQGASLLGVHLQGASLDEAQLQGASLNETELQGASLSKAELQGAWLYEAELQGASLDGAQLQDASLVNVLVWRAFGTPNLDGAELRNIDVHQKPWKGEETFAEWRDAIANAAPNHRDGVIEHLAMLDPTGEPAEVLDQRFWDMAHSSQPKGEEVWIKRATLLADLACLEDSAPYVARRVLRNFKPRFTEAEFLDASGRKLFTDRLLKGKSDPTACLGIRDFTDEDWADLSKLSSETYLAD